MTGGGWLRRLAGRGPRRRPGETAAKGWCEWRPEGWLAALDKPEVAGATSPTAFGAGLTLFHDSPLAEIGLAQVETGKPTEDQHGVAVLVRQFEGTYLSLVVDLPSDRAGSLDSSAIVGLTVCLPDEAARNVAARLNLRTGPNLITMARTPRPEGGVDGRQIAEFDLGRSDLGDRRVSAAWLDLIFDAPRVGSIEVTDLVVSRHRRAAF